MIATQFDWAKRVVSLVNLEAMCKYISGTCHEFKVSKVTRNRAYVEYSNPTEYGTPEPMTLVLPCYPGGWDSTAVVLDILNVQHDNWHGEGWQAFQPLLDCPTLWRNPQTDTWEESK
jgi:hypothetical protein